MQSIYREIETAPFAALGISKDQGELAQPRQEIDRVTYQESDRARPTGLTSESGNLAGDLDTDHFDIGACPETVENPGEPDTDACPQLQDAPAGGNSHSRVATSRKSIAIGSLQALIHTAPEAAFAIIVHRAGVASATASPAPARRRNS